MYPGQQPYGYGGGYVQGTTTYNAPVMQPGVVQQQTTTYGAQPMMQPMMQPMTQPMMQPMMQPGVVQQTTTLSIPSAYNRTFYQYPGMYNRYDTFIVPGGLDPFAQARFMEASQIFRTFDRNCSGTLSWHEWKEAMQSLGHYMGHYEAENLFRLIDRDGSGRIDEREFCEYWAFACHPTSGYFRAPHHHHHHVDISIPTPHIHLPRIHTPHLHIPSVSVHLGHHHHHHHKKW